MVFLIQNTQNRDSKAVQLKLDELLRAVGEARTGMVLEDLSDEELKKLEKEFQEIRKKEGPLAAAENGVTEAAEKVEEAREEKSNKNGKR